MTVQRKKKGFTWEKKSKIILCSIQREYYVNKQFSGILTSFLHNLLLQVGTLTLHFGRSDGQHLMESCPLSLGLFLYEGCVPRKLFDARIKSKEKHYTRV